MKRGHDSIGRGKPSSTGNIVQGERPLGRDYRANTASGRTKHSGPSEHLGTRLVGDRMLKAEREQKVDSGGRGVKFRIEDENRAKEINHDAEPR
jgi:hypothetical protein